MIQRVSKKREFLGQVGSLRSRRCYCECHICRDDCLDWISLAAARAGAAASHFWGI